MIPTVPSGRSGRAILPLHDGADRHRCSCATITIVLTLALGACASEDGARLSGPMNDDDETPSASPVEGGDSPDAEADGVKDGRGGKDGGRSVDAAAPRRDGGIRRDADAGSSAEGPTTSPADAAADAGRVLDGGAERTDASSDDASAADAGASCDLPRSFRWKSSGPLVSPKSPPGRDFVSIKDATVVYWNDRYHVYATVYDRTARGWSMVYLNFEDWSEANAAPQYHMANSPTRGGVAPHLFYFSPKKKWVLVYQWGASYSTTDDPSKPETWTPPAPLLSNPPRDAIDFWVICDSAQCHLFFSNDHGQLYQAKMPIGRFPSAFSDAKVIMSDTAANLFEASNVFKVKGTNKYLLLVEAYGPRYFRSWTSTSLDGPWAPLAATQQQPFAGKSNVIFDGPAWTDDISHGDLVRDNPDETMTIDACRMEFVYQGANPRASSGGDYNLIPYRLGLLTPTR